jgi:hypothetical protein
MSRRTFCKRMPQFGEEGKRKTEDGCGYCSVTVMVDEVSLGYTGTWVPDPGGSEAVQQPRAIVFPEYTTYNEFEPLFSRDPLSGMVTADVPTPVGSSAAVCNKVEST